MKSGLAVQKSGTTSYNSSMHITVISDTHRQHDKLGRLSGEVLIHCGDMFSLFDGRDDDMERIDAWFGEQVFDLILCTGGNHDFALEDRIRAGQKPFQNAEFLQDQGVTHKGVTFYGAPWTPYLSGHAFYQDSAGLREKWAQIPSDTDVLITHTPPAGILDVSSQGLVLGCQYLADAILSIRPRLHCFGHVHASSGQAESNGTTYINAAVVNSQFGLARGPYEFVI